MTCCSEHGNSPKMCLSGRASLHGLVVGMKMRIVVNLQCRGVERCDNLVNYSVSFRTTQPVYSVHYSYLCTNGILEGRIRTHGGELSSHVREAQGVSSKHGFWRCRCWGPAFCMSMIGVSFRRVEKFWGLSHTRSVRHNATLTRACKTS